MSADLVSIGEIGKLQILLSNEQWIKSCTIGYICQFHKDIIIPTVGCFSIFSQSNTRDRTGTFLSFAICDIIGDISKREIWCHTCISLMFMPCVHPLRAQVAGWCPSVFELEWEGSKNAHFTGSDHFHIDSNWSSKIGINQNGNKLISETEIHSLHFLHAYIKMESSNYSKIVTWPTVPRNLDWTCFRGAASEKHHTTEYHC